MNQEQIVEALNTFTAPQLVALTKRLEETWGVNAAPVPTAMPVPYFVDGVAEQTEFTVMLTAAGANKIGAIKVVREVLGLGLKEAKDLVESPPKVIKEGVTKDEAEVIKAKFAEVGSSVDVR